MRGALVIFTAMIVIGIALYLIDIFYYRRKHRSHNQDPETQNEDDTLSSSTISNSQNSSAHDTSSAGGDGEVCCGMHIVCEKTNLSPISGEVVYYDDEELDRFRGREPESYTEEETEEFRDVLLTLLPEDVAGWSRSIQVREITLPYEVRDELLLIVSELRQNSK